MSAKLTIGVPPYLVARPLHSGLEREAGFEIVRAVPSELVERLRARTVDVALVSSIEIFRASGYRFVDGAAVIARGEISSVKLFLRRPIERVRTVVLDPASRAAQTLVRILLAKRFGRDAVSYVEPGREVDPREEAERIDADAWLAIGDRALRTSFSTAAPQSLDPAGEWLARTGLPFVFAVWAVRPGVELGADRAQAFVAARERGAQRIEALAREASETWKLPYDRCLLYLSRECVYDPARDLARSLFAFRDAAAELGLADRALAPLSVPLADPHVAAPH
jgi:chorismate dehydratase